MVTWVWLSRLSALLAILWGTVLILPGDLFADIKQYQYFNQYAPDFVWGIFMVVGSFMLLYPFLIWLNRLGHLLLCSIWLGIFILVLISGLNLGIVLISSLCLYISIIHAFQYLRLGYSL